MYAECVQLELMTTTRLVRMMLASMSSILAYHQHPLPLVMSGRLGCNLDHTSRPFTVKRLNGMVGRQTTTAKVIMNRITRHCLLVEPMEKRLFYVLHCLDLAPGTFPQNRL
jgi:hypothetical protein